MIALCISADVRQQAGHRNTALEAPALGTPCACACLASQNTLHFRSFDLNLDADNAEVAISLSSTGRKDAGPDGKI